jgi:heme-degrading monooxygenase HmoA
MFSRIVTFTGATDVDAGVRYLQDTVVPMLQEQKGFSGVTASADRASGVLGVMSLWETEADRDASESTMVKARQEGQRVIGGEVTVEHFEELLAELARPPAAGCSLLLRRISMDPAQVEDNLDFFRREVLPRMKASPGFCAVRNMINRQTGEGMGGSLWADEASMDAWAEAAEALRQQGPQRGVTFGELSRRELVFVDLR